MSDWGVPDWRDASAYPADPSEWTPARWFWEFTRRRDDYRKETLFLLRLIEERDGALVAQENDPTPEKKCATRTLQEQLRREWHAHFNKWGFLAALDPRVSEHPEDNLLRWLHSGVKSMVGSPPDKRSHRGMLTPAPDELAVTINLDRPLERQLATVARVAREKQRARHGKLLERRRRVDGWAGYLRALDAKEAGATLAEMAAQFFSDGILDRRRLEDGTWGPPPPQAASRLVRAGEALQSNFPD